MTAPTVTRLRWDATDTDRLALSRAVQGLLGEDATDAKLGAEHGWYGIGVPEELGGHGGSFADLAHVAEEVGANVAATPAAWTAAIAGQLLARAEDPPGELIGALVGEARALAVPLLGRPIPDATSGHLDLDVLALGTADALLAMPVRTSVGTALLLLDAVDERITTSAVASLDHTRPLTRFSATALDLRDAIVVTVQDLERTWTATIGTVSALDAVGTARVALTRTIDYARTREQFGRPIGSFQAYKHKCATAFVDLRLAQALAFGAAGDPSGELGLRAAAHCARAAAKICSEAIVLHGGIGFTWESGLHAYQKRSRVDEVLASRHGRAAQLLTESFAR